MIGSAAALLFVSVAADWRASRQQQTSCYFHHDCSVLSCYLHHCLSCFCHSIFNQLTEMLIITSIKLESRDFLKFFFFFSNKSFSKNCIPSFILILINIVHFQEVIPLWLLAKTSQIMFLLCSCMQCNVALSRWR